MRNKRLLVLSVALIAGLLAAFLVLSSGGNAPEKEVLAEVQPVTTEDVLVAALDVKLGSKLDSSDLQWAAWPKGSVPQGAVLKSEEPDALDIYSGQIAKSPIYQGEPVRSERLTDTQSGFMASILPKGKRAIAVKVGAETTAGGFILPGDKVDLILTTTKSGSRAYSETILQNIRILAIDTTTAGEQDEKNLDPERTATLELTLGQAERVAQAQELGELSLALRSVEDSADSAVTEVGSKGGVQYIKFGISSQAGSR